MTGYIGNAADAAQQIASDSVDNGIYAIRQAMSHAYGVVSRSKCKDCNEDIPEGRRRAVPGVMFCVDCQDHHLTIRKVKMLTKML